MNIPPGLHVLHKELSRSMKRLFSHFAVKKIPGVGYDVKGIREYAPEDSHRHIDRSTTAKKNSLHVREIEQEKYSYRFVLDQLDKNNGATFEMIQQVAYSIGYSAIKDGSAIAMVQGSKMTSPSRNLAGLTSMLTAVPNQKITGFSFLDKIEFILFGKSNSGPLGGSTLGTTLKNLLKKKVKGSMMVIITDSISIDKTIIHGLAMRNKIFRIHIQDLHEYEIASRTGFLTIGSGDTQSLIKNTPTLRKKYGENIEKQIKETKRLITSSGGTYVGLHAEEDVLKGLLSQLGV